jgi:hypothetical protein
LHWPIQRAPIEDDLVIGTPPHLQHLPPDAANRAAFALAGQREPPRPGSLSNGFAHLGLLALPPLMFLMAMSGGFVLSEPAPYELMFIMVLGATLLANAPFPSALVLPFVLICANIIAGIIAILTGPSSADPLRYIAVAAYLSLSAIILAMAICTGPMRVLPAVRWGYTIGATGAALCGILGYFGVAGLDGPFTLSGRAKGPFADPNVFGPFLVFPAVFLIIDILRGGGLRVFIALGFFSVIMLGLLLSFSRGAWAHVAVSTIVAVVLLYITSDQALHRIRLVVTGFVALAVATVALAGLLSVPEVGDLFSERAKFVQPYDVAGNVGRFSTQAAAIDEITKRPFGFGALGFSDKYGLDPHNVYLKVFTSNGWIGGLAYISYVLVTLMAGIQATLSRTPWRLFALVATATFAGQVAEGFIIDTDPWRHFHLTAGVIWGCFAAKFVAARLAPPHHPAVHMAKDQRI